MCHSALHCTYRFLVLSFIPLLFFLPTSNPSLLAAGWGGRIWHLPFVSQVSLHNWEQKRKAEQQVYHPGTWRHGSLRGDQTRHLITVKGALLKLYNFSQRCPVVTSKLCLVYMYLPKYCGCQNIILPIGWLLIISLSFLLDSSYYISCLTLLTLLQMVELFLFILQSRS